MKLEHAKLIVNAANDMGAEVTLRENYSGRGMYGKTTAGVVGTLGDVTKSIAYAASLLTEDDPDKVEEFIENMDLAWDNMGKELILY
jgi:hypothetical protein